ncbi:hypothetical protein ACRQ5Q_22530 [Bradyrhizobium sp. PMVTL-01]|uniref:hypothetical protein n=1 Tax=Bradyrhizobium sp. PMVTL-01 TaxID=3434999 RepID=UPI003F7095EE
MRKAFEMVERDGGGHLVGRIYPGTSINFEAFSVPESWAQLVSGAESGLARLTEEDFETFVVGEQSEQVAILKRQGDLTHAHVLIDGYFDGWPSENTQPLQVSASNADHPRDPNPWQPITDAVDLKHLGKLAEELGECTSAVSRCIIQGVDEREPMTKKLNREWLEDEIADVLASIELVIDHFKLNSMKIIERAEKKERFLQQWHAQA